MLKSSLRPLQVRLVKQQKELQRELGELEYYGKSAATPEGKVCMTREAAEAFDQKLGIINAKLAMSSKQV